MLTEKTEIRNVTEHSEINGIKVCEFYANINSNDPLNIDLGRSIINKKIYKENRGQVMKDQVNFENHAYSIQDKMIAEKSTTMEEVKE